MEQFNRQRTIYMTKEDMELVPEVGKKLEQRYPDKSFKARGEYSLSAIVRFLLEREVKSDGI